MPAAITNQRARTSKNHVKSIFQSLPGGVSLTRDESKGSYAVIRHNIRTYESGGVMAVIRGREQAEASVAQFERGQSSEDRHAGWRYFLEKTDLKPGMNPEEATNLRQTRLEVRESEAPPFADQTPNSSRHN